MDYYSDVQSQPQRYARLRHVLLWDGLLNLSVILIPFLVESLWPNQMNILDFVCAFVPVIFLFVRFFLALPWMQNHNVTPFWYACQQSIFGVTVLFWLFFESFLMSLHFAPNSATLVIGCLVIGFPIYLFAMGLAFYPGQTSDSNSDVEFDRSELN